MSDKQVFELTVVYPTGDKTEELQKSVEAGLKKQKVKVLSQEDWGERDLAYPVHKQEKGVYVHAVLEMDASQVVEVRKTLGGEKRILRWLLVKVDKRENTK